MLRTTPKVKEAVLYTLRAGGLKADVQFLAASELLKHTEHFTGIVADLSWTKKSLPSGLCLHADFAGQANTLLTSDTNTDTVLRATPSQTLSVYVGSPVPPCATTLPQSLKKSKPVRLMPASNSESTSVPAGPTVMVNNQPVEKYWCQRLISLPHALLRWPNNAKWARKRRLVLPFLTLTC